MEALFEIQYYVFDVYVTLVAIILSQLIMS